MLRLFLNNAVRHLKEKRQLGIVLGNEACDLDSVVCSIAYAYLLDKVKKTPHVPVLNIFSLEELSLRGEVIHWLQSNQLGSVPLACLPDAIAALNITKRETAPPIHVILVDHQGGDVAPECAELYALVNQMVDHHEPFYQQVEEPADIDTFLENGRRCVSQPVGSCATLITQLYIRYWDELAMGDNAVEVLDGAITALKLLYGAIILDTGCCAPNNGRTTSKDMTMALWIEEKLKSKDVELGWERGSCYKALSEAKLNISGFSVAQLLRKDLKFIRRNGVAVAAVPSVGGLDAMELLAKDGCLEALRGLCMSSDPPLLWVVVNIAGVPPGNVGGAARRCLVLFCNDKSEAAGNMKTFLLQDKKATSLLNASLVSDSLCDKDRNMLLLQVNNPKATRKQILPLLERYFNRL